MIVGIDLGTTHSLVGVWKDGGATLIPNALGQLLTPSVVASDDERRILVGQAARDRMVTHPSSAAATFKRYMGSDRKFGVAGRMLRPEELSSLVLKSLKADAEAFLGETVDEAVITVPAYFNDAQRKATKAAGELAGLKVDRLLTEPTAAALAYGFTTGDEESTILVIDMGGGTLDVSLLHSFEGIMEVRATAGDIWLGGEDFTQLIATAFMAEAGNDAGLPPFAGKLPVHASILRQAEIIKRDLSDAEEARLEVNYQGRAIGWTLQREAFEKMCEPLMARVRLPLERALRDARVAPETLSRIVFAGGATRMPMFRRLIARLFRQLPVHHINPDEVVARGAAVRAGLIAKGSGLEERVLTDVAPFTLGIEVTSRVSEGMLLPGTFLPIIERNTVIPASRSHVVTTLQDNQTKLLVKVYQGESRMVRDNVYLGEVAVMIRPARAGEETVEVRFTYDTSGLLEVEAKPSSYDHVESLVIE
ncbi:MAG: molecular chaperone HscC, partial [Alphaproteobacteria bacterium]|nr:molecular chaperone HscC [Alphaproteobacteria bacterium]